MRWVRRSRFWIRALVSASVMLSVLAVALPVPFPSPGLPERNPFVTATNQAGHDIPDVFLSMGGYFIENRGQATDGVHYYHIGNPSVAFRDDGVMFVFRQYEKSAVGMRGEGRTFLPGLTRQPSASHEHAVKSFAYTLRFEGANPVKPLGIGRLPFDSNFFIDNDQGEWRTGVANYQAIMYEDVYDGIDLAFRSGPDGLKYEFIVSPWASPESISLRFEGVKLLMSRGTDLLLSTAMGDVVDSLPLSFQDSGEPVSCRFLLRDASSYGFECTGRDPSKTLTIDPLVYSTFIGGNVGVDEVMSMNVDHSGNAYVVGATTAADFPTTAGSYDTSLDGIFDVFVAKLNPEGNSLVYSTFFGGGNDEYPWSSALDSSGNTYVAGWTNSADLPVTPGAYDGTYNGGDVDSFVMKLNATGSGLIYSTYIGGDASDIARSIAVDVSGNAYVTGDTHSANFPTTAGAFDTTYGGTPSNYEDVFVTKLSAGGGTLVYSTFLGAGGREIGEAIAVGLLGEAFVTGVADSGTFPTTPGAFDTSHNGGVWDAFVTKLSMAGSTLLFSTFLGGNDVDVPQDLSLDSLDHIVVAGDTYSADFPTTFDAFDGTHDLGADIFLTKLTQGGGVPTYSTFLGGSGADSAVSVALGSNNSLCLTGWTDSLDYPLSLDADDNDSQASSEGIVTVMDSTGGSIVYSTYLGGISNDWGYSIALDASGNIYVAGTTYSSDFPTTPGAFDVSRGSTIDGFVTKFGPGRPDLAISPPDIGFLPPGPVANGTMVVLNATVHNIGTNSTSGVVVRFYDGPPSVSNQIGSDQVIPFIGRLGGTGVASVGWTAGPPGTHEICVVADPDNATAEANENNNAACRTINVAFSALLTPGHRFMSFPLLPPDVRIAAVLSSISGCYDYVRSYDVLDSSDPWRSYEPGRNYNDLQHLDNTMGFWINITSACGLMIIGTKENSTTLSLRQGWNMVGFPSFNTTYTVADLKADLGLTGVIVEAFDANAAPYYLRRVTDSYAMKAGEGYWIYVPSDTVWVVIG